MADQIALLCLLHPASSDKRSRVLSLLSQNNTYYRSPHASCTTWCYFTPSTRPKAPKTLVSSEDNQFLVAGLEIYTNKQALSVQQQDQSFQSYHALVKSEGLYQKDEQLIAYYPNGGFVARDDLAEPCGSGVIVMIAKFLVNPLCRNKALDVLRPFAEWVQSNEPDVLTYSLMTRPKAPNEILMFERYRSGDALKGHGSSKTFAAML